jgi:hypothetical protein
VRMLTAVERAISGESGMLIAEFRLNGGGRFT